MHFCARLAFVTCFPAFGTDYMLFRNRHWLPAFVTGICFPALGTGYTFSRAWHGLNVFPHLASAASDFFGFGFRIVTRTKAFPHSLTCFRRCKHSPRALSQIHSTLSKLTLSKCSAVHVTAVTDFTCPRKCCRHSPLTTSHTRTPPLAAPLTTWRLLV